MIPRNEQERRQRRDFFYNFSTNRAEAKNGALSHRLEEETVQGGQERHIYCVNSSTRNFTRKIKKAWAKKKKKKFDSGTGKYF